MCWTVTAGAAAAGFVAGVIVSSVVCKLRGKGACKCAGKGKSVRKGEQVFPKTHPAPADGSIEIYVGNLSYDMTDELLNQEFSAYGKVNSARIITNRYTGKSKGFGFVHMPNQAEADAAVKALNDKEILGRRIKCNEAKNVIK